MITSIRTVFLLTSLLSSIAAFSMDSKQSEVAPKKKSHTLPRKRCEPCRAAHARCTKRSPCKRCKRLGLECIHPALAFSEHKTSSTQNLNVVKPKEVEGLPAAENASATSTSEADLPLPMDQGTEMETDMKVDARYIEDCNWQQLANDVAYEIASTGDWSWRLFDTIMDGQIQPEAQKSYHLWHLEH